jgi:hypothetical protein
LTVFLLSKRSRRNRMNGGGRRAEACRSRTRTWPTEGETEACQIRLCVAGHASWRRKISGPAPCHRPLPANTGRGTERGERAAERAGSGIVIPEPHHSDRETASNRAESRSTLSDMAARPNRPAYVRRRTNIPAICLKQFRRSRRINARQSITTLFCIPGFPRNLNRNDSRSEQA